ncbi:MAG: NAD(P)-dependent glycerol-3-phosphate dehydrogenase [Candidatus Omnitrophica bacterium]|nr:NAD(P)-dependent glycerol-3-phosphate dehydrogenase [Candidatus Omnitrophota bacterium]
MHRITVLGSGGWGTCLAVHLATHGHSVTLWGATPQYAAEIERRRENPKFLPGVPIPDAVRITGQIEVAWEAAEMMVVAVPSQYLRGVLRRHKGRPWDSLLTVSVVKGIEPNTLLRMSEVIRQEVSAKRLAVLSGPSISYEVARGVPTTVVSASEDSLLAREVQSLFTTERFRVYTSSDVVGVELGGALKNVMAIACGISDGLGFGANTKAALVTRGLVEMARLGNAAGAKAETFYGLSGLGDLVTTCFSQHSRNRSVGEKIGKGIPISEITAGMEQVAEGVTTAQSAHVLGRKHGAEMPISTAVYQVLFEGKAPSSAVQDLMLRDPKPE